MLNIDNHLTIILFLVKSTYQETRRRYVYFFQRAYFPFVCLTLFSRESGNLQQPLSGYYLFFYPVDEADIIIGYRDHARQNYREAHLFDQTLWRC